MSDADDFNLDDLFAEIDVASTPVDRTGIADLFEGREDYTTVPWLDRMLACRACRARDEARRVVPGSGPLDAEIAVVGQNPGEDEDAMGVAFVGRPGVELDTWLERLDLDRERVLITNAVKCHTARNRQPTPREATTCRDLWLRQEVETFANLRVLIPLGRPALQSLLGGAKQATPPAMQPWWTEVALDTDDARRLLVVPLPHPSYLLRSPGLRDRMYTEVLPTVRAYLMAQAPDVYTRAKRR